MSDKAEFEFDARVDVEKWQGQPVMLVDLPSNIRPGRYHVTLTSLDLLQCPFCDCETEANEIFPENNWYGRCMSPLCGWEMGPFRSRADAVQAMNRRA